MAQDRVDRELLEQVGRGEFGVLDALLAQHRERLRRMVELRLDRRLLGRIDSSDVVQEAYLEAYRRIEDFRQSPEVPFYVWLRFLTTQKLAQLHRQQLGVQARDAGREVALRIGPEASSEVIAAEIAAASASPSHAAMLAETKSRLQQAIEQLEPIDREVLALRHFEQLTNSETAVVLGVSEPAATNRYVRALERLRKVFAEMAWEIGEVEP